MPTTTATLRPLRDAVEGLGFDFDALAGPVLARYVADVVVEARPATDRDGRIFVHCGGEAILAFYPSRQGTTFPEVVTRTGRPIYLVRDDEDGRRWDALRRQGVAMHAMPEHDLPTYRPSPRLRLVQSA